MSGTGATADRPSLETHVVAERRASTSARLVPFSERGKGLDRRLCAKDLDELAQSRVRQRRLPSAPTREEPAMTRSRSRFVGTFLAATMFMGAVGTANADLSRFDTSGHKVSFVTVEPGVQLEVLDWGGTGETMVLLAGLGNTAHVFDDFAHQFTDRFHVMGITRRGFGRSSQPAGGYDIATRARDDIKVLDSLNIRAAVLVGHSIAGTELSKIGADYPDRVQKLVYLDSLDYGWGGWATITRAAAPPPPEPTEADMASINRLAAYMARLTRFRSPIAELCQQVRADSAGKPVQLYHAA